jgi:hypothetical protein
MCFVKIITHFDPKPIPTSLFDWSAVYEDDLGETAVGYGSTMEDAKNDLLESFPREEDEA